MAKLNQIIALVAGEKSRCQKTITDIYHKFQKEKLFVGITRKYRPKDEERGEQLPPEEHLVTCRVTDLIDEFTTAMTRLFDLVSTQDLANTSAGADVVVDGTVVLSDVSVTTILFLEKQMGDIHTFVTKIPIVDPSEKWEWSKEANCLATPMKEGIRTKKVPKVLVKFAATKEHPAQTDVYTEDIQVGTWETINFCGGLQAETKDVMLKKVEALQDALKVAREEANNREVTDSKIGGAIFDYLGMS